MELADAFGCKMFALLESDSEISIRMLRYIYYAFKTFWILIVSRPKIVFVQNPSIVLAFVVCLVKDVFKFRVVVDRHSNFKLATVSLPEMKWRLFHWLSRYTLSRADLTIVTNDFDKALVTANGGRGEILQDRLPQLPLAEPVKLEGEVNLVVVSTFSDDEPLDAVFEAAEAFPSEWRVYVTGKYQGKEGFRGLIEQRPANVVLTGFLPEKEYQSLFLSAEIVIVLTTEENLLTCGAYEAISLGKALVLSDTEALRAYFSYGPLYTENDHFSLKENVCRAIQQREQLEGGVQRLKNDLEVEWRGRFNRLVGLISDLALRVLQTAVLDRVGLILLWEGCDER